MITVNVTEHETTEFNAGDFVICDGVIGYIIEMAAGEENTYARIDWLDGAKTEHRYQDLSNDGIKRAVHPENLPHFAR